MRTAFLFSLLGAGLLIASQAWAQQPAKPPTDNATSEADIRKAAASYVEAFNKHDAQGLAEHWSPDAVYTNRSTGEEVAGREAIREQFTSLFEEQPDLKLKVSVTSVQFVSPNVAVESGTTSLISPNSEPEEIEYSAVHIKQAGKWLIDRVTDKSKEVIPSHYEQLKVLEWMIGEWTNESDDATVDVECNWTKNKNFITRAFKISIPDQADFSGMQIIGWDPATKRIRSWTFDANGTFAEATWEQKGKRWYIRNRGVLSDGRTATMVNVMQQVDDKSFTWQTVERTAGSELQPNLAEIVIVRQ